MPELCDALIADVEDGQDESLKDDQLDEAIELAARIPPARVGSIEIRPIRPIREMARQRG